MSLFDLIKKVGVKKAVAPTPVDSTNSAMFPQDDNTNAFIAGHENYFAYGDLPNILGPLNQNEAYHNPGSLHAPFTVNRNQEAYTSGGGRHFFDGANPAIERIPRSSLQVQFDTKREVPVPPALIPSSGVEVPNRLYNYGWSQCKTPSPLDGVYAASVLIAPPQHLSRGINVLQSQLPNDMHRQGYKAKAPKQKRSV